NARESCALRGWDDGVAKPISSVAFSYATLLLCLWTSTYADRWPVWCRAIATAGSHLSLAVSHLHTSKRCLSILTSMAKPRLENDGRSFNLLYDWSFDLRRCSASPRGAHRSSRSTPPSPSQSIVPACSQWMIDRLRCDCIHLHVRPVTRSTSSPGSMT